MDDDKLKRTCKPGDYRKMLFGEKITEMMNAVVSRKMLVGDREERS